MQTFARALPERFNALSGAARDLTAATAQRAHREIDRAITFGGALQRRLEGVVDHDTRAALAHGARREFDRAAELSAALQSRLEHVTHRGRRSSRLPVAVGVLVVGAAIGGALLSSPRLRATLRDGWDRARGRRPGEPIRIGDGYVGDGYQRTAAKPAQDRQEDLLDEGIEESFPASDPVSVKRIT